MSGTCGMACWMAQEDVCRCMCDNANHGIMRDGGEQPGRFCQRKGKQYRLESIHEDWLDANDASSKLSKQYNEGHGLEWWRESAFHQRASGHMLKWPEVKICLATEFQKRKRWGPEAYLVWVLMEPVQNKEANK